MEEEDKEANKQRMTDSQPEAVTPPTGVTTQIVIDVDSPSLPLLGWLHKETSDK